MPTPLIPPPTTTASSSGMSADGWAAIAPAPVGSAGARGKAPPAGPGSGLLNSAFLLKGVNRTPVERHHRFVFVRSRFSLFVFSRHGAQTQARLPAMANGADAARLVP